MRRWRIRSGRRSDHQHELARRGAGEVFLEPPVRPNGLRQADFFQFETTIEDTWRLYNVVDYATKLALACPVSTT